VTVFLHRYFRPKLFVSVKHFIVFYLTIFLIGTAWDNFAIWRGHWTYGQRLLFGPKVLNMPIEEFGFMAVTVYFGLVIYRLCEQLFRQKGAKN
jgi:lycopene cyclase domain-containing protein